MIYLVLSKLRYTMYTGDVYEKDGVYIISNRQGNKSCAERDCHGEKVEHFSACGRNRAGMAEERSVITKGMKYKKELTDWSVPFCYLPLSFTSMGVMKGLSKNWMNRSHLIKNA